MINIKELALMLVKLNIKRADFEFSDEDYNEMSVGINELMRDSITITAATSMIDTEFSLKIYDMKLYFKRKQLANDIKNEHYAIKIK